MNILYTGLFLTEGSRKDLLEAFPPKFGRVFMDHVTLAFRPDDKTIQTAYALRGKVVNLFVLAHVSDEKGQALWIGCSELQGLTVTQDVLHITVSCADGTSPVYSNKLLAGSAVQRDVICRAEATVGLCDTDERDKLPLDVQIRRGLAVNRP